jgi:hypothetical protein
LLLPLPPSSMRVSCIMFKAIVLSGIASPVDRELGLDETKAWSLLYDAAADFGSSSQ